jgi:hypothetical protein
MGILRKTFIVGTMGAGRAAVNPNSKKARTAKSNEKMAKIEAKRFKAEKKAMKAG